MVHQWKEAEDKSLIQSLDNKSEVVMSPKLLSQDNRLCQRDFKEGDFSKDSSGTLCMLLYWIFSCMYNKQQGALRGYETGFSLSTCHFFKKIHA